MKEQILKLRSEGLSYLQITKIVGCSSGTVCYYCGKGQKEKTLQRKRKNDKTSIGTILSKKWSGFRRKRGEIAREDGISFKDILNKFGENPTCYLTGELIDLYDTKSYHFDHIIPVAKGGTGTLDNLGLTIKYANIMKHDMSVDELLIMCEKILKYNNKV